MIVENQIIKGISWISAFRISTRAISFIKVALLARILTPLQLGDYAVATLILTVFETLAQTGSSVILVQKKKMTGYINAAYFISICRGTILFFIIFAISGVVARYFNSTGASDLIRIISFVALVRGFINPGRVIFLKNLEYPKETVFSVVVYLVDVVFAVILTFKLNSPAGIVYGLLFGAITETLMSYIFIKIKPQLKFEKRKIVELLTRGKWVTGSGILMYLNENLDDFIAGKFIGVPALGMYQVAYKISTLPVTEIGKVFNQVTFPVYAKISDNRNKLKKVYFRTLISSMLIVIPLSAIIYLYAYEITLLVLGQKWIEIVPIIRSLAVFAILRSLVISINPLFNAIKKQDLVAKVSLYNLIIVLISIIPLLKIYGIVGVALSLVISSLLTLPVVSYCLFTVFKNMKSAIN